ncbi:galectin, putative [Pediculus humanus corporis]|uniref:Galectin n=1 Tax=Pediculus humanus subsp. corporis TaxID=121224 RepID=E0VKZ0_PEDHC|nr:galectin, putative [Pediculus humanus corporis]EEB14046.1 galectin, putative [Pediculus humanus corporis]
MAVENSANFHSLHCEASLYEFYKMIRFVSSKTSVKIMDTIQNPAVPFNLPIPNGMCVGKMITVQGMVPSISERFAVNLLSHSHDIALHVSPRFKEKYIARNSVQNMNWGPEENNGALTMFPGQGFEIIILCEEYDFKIAIQGRHFAEFKHRLPYKWITNIAVDGDVIVHNVYFKETNNNQMNNNNPNTMPYGFHQPAGIPSQLNSGGMHPQNPQYNNNPGLGFNSGSGPQYPQGSLYPQQPNYGQMNKNSNTFGQTNGKPDFLRQAAGTLVGILGGGGCSGLTRGQRAPPPPPPAPTAQNYSSILDQAGSALSGILGGRGLGTLGTAIAGAALTGHLNPIKAVKKQKKAQKKALKYGLPLAGVGLGAYAIHKGFKGFRRSSSSSSSSSNSD